MISVILLIFTLLLVVIGGICGFHRGIIKQGVRTSLWVVLFAGSLFFVPKLTDTLLVVLVQKFSPDVNGVEQIIEIIMSKAGILSRETALILPLSGMLRSLIIPFVTLVLFWLSGLVSLVIYAIGNLFIKNTSSEQKKMMKVAGTVLGILVALFAGSVTLYPLVSVSNAIEKGDYDQTLQKEIKELSFVSDIYEGSVTSKLYRYTGAEQFGNTLHNTVVSLVVEKENNIWTEFPAIIQFGNESWKTYRVFSGESTEDVSMGKQIPQVLEAFFGLNFISDETQIHFISNIKNTLTDSLGDSPASKILGWIEVQNREQFTKDMSVLGNVFDILNKEGVLTAIVEGNRMPSLREETINALLDSFAELSNADVVISEVITLFYSSMLDDMELPLEMSDIKWTEKTKEELSEIVAVVSEISGDADSLENISEDKKEEILKGLQSLEGNSVINEEQLKELLNSYENK